jgi:DNA-binding transcriptional LysR family regulator
LKAVIVPFIAALKPLAPGIRVRIIPESPATLLAQSERGEVDIALLTPHDTPPALHSRALYQEDYVCLMREDHPQASQPRRSTALRWNMCWFHGRAIAFAA